MFNLLAQHVSQGEVRDVWRMLPGDVRTLWPVAGSGGSSDRLTGLVPRRGRAADDLHLGAAGGVEATIARDGA